MKRILILSFFIHILTSFSFGQIQIGGSQPEPVKEKKEKVKKVRNDSTDYSMKVFAGTSISSTFRRLEPNKNDLFADSLGSRANEKSKAYWSFHLGFSSDISRHFMWEAGVSFLRNGEQYNFPQNDSTHTYTTRHSWIGVPIKFYFKHDFNKLRLQVGIGAIPHMQMKYKRTDSYVQQDGTRITNDLKTINGMNTFGVSVIGNAGIHYSLSKRTGIYLMFEYRQQLTSSYWKTNPYIHKGTAIGANFGLTFGI